MNRSSGCIRIGSSLSGTATVVSMASAEYAVLVRAMIAHYQKIGKAASIKHS
jgi:hypothetical protein